MTEETIFAAALEKKSPGERQSFLEQACAGNPDLRAQVEELLKADSNAGSFLNHPPVGLDATVASDSGSRDTAGSGTWAAQLSFLKPCNKPDRLGQLDDYEIIEVVGHGGMGAVLRAFDTKLSRVVAVKVMSPTLAANPTAVKRFLREATTAAAVHHDHVVTIHAVDDSHQPPYIVMQFVEGQTLQQKIDREGALELKHILRIGSQAAAGLAAAHKLGLIHRDVKPANILLENGVERVKITDFGLARAADDVQMTQTGIIAGTPQYMSPEQARGEPVDARSDLFSLGSVLYTMCTGRPAFRADHPVAVLRRVCDDTPRPIRDVNPEIPDWLEAIVSKLLAKDRADRFQSAAEVADLLSQHLAHVQNPAQFTPPPLTVNPQQSQPPASVAEKKPNAPPMPLWLSMTGLVVTGFGLLSTYLPGTFSLDPWGLTATNAALIVVWVGAMGYWLVASRTATHASRRKRTDAAPLQMAGHGAPATAADVLLTPPPGWLAPTGMLLALFVIFVNFLQTALSLNTGPLATISLSLLGTWVAAMAIWLISNARRIRLNVDERLRRLRSDSTNIPILGKRKPVSRGVLIEHPVVGLVAIMMLLTSVGVATYLITSAIGRKHHTPLFQTSNSASFPPGATAGSSSSVSPPLAVAPFDADKAKQHQDAWANHLGVPVELSNSVGMKLRLIPPGDFLMGTASDAEQLRPERDWYFASVAEGRAKAQQPQHAVRITRPFYVGEFEVTISQFREFVKHTGYQTQAERDPTAGVGWRNGKWVRSTEFNWDNPGFPISDDQPVCNITWNDAKAFCKWLSEKEGLDYRLPTEAQWEFACRAGTTTNFYSGSDPSSLQGVANLADSTLRAAEPTIAWAEPWSDGFAFTAPVGSFKSNPFSLFDMHGNVCEWCEDFYDPNYYANASSSDPTGPATGKERVFRGGGWHNWPGFCRSADRYSSHSPTLRTDWAGLRVAIVGDLTKLAAPRATAGSSSSAPRPDPVAIKPLRDLVAAKDRLLKTAEARFAAAVAPRTEVIAARIDHIEAQIRLAEAQQQPATVRSLLKEFVAQREEERRHAETLVKNLAATASLLDEADARLADAKARLAQANAAVSP